MKEEACEEIKEQYSKVMLQMVLATNNNGWECKDIKTGINLLDYTADLNIRREIFSHNLLKVRSGDPYESCIAGYKEVLTSEFCA